MTDAPEQMTTNQIGDDYSVQFSAIEVNVSASGEVTVRLENADSRRHARLFRNATSGTKGLLVSRVRELRAQAKPPLGKSATVSISLWAKEGHEAAAGPLFESEKAARRLVADHARGLARLRNNDVTTVELKRSSKKLQVCLVMKRNFDCVPLDVSTRKKAGQTCGNSLASQGMKTRTSQSSAAEKRRRKQNAESRRTVDKPDVELYNRLSELLTAVSDGARTPDSKDSEIATADTTTVFNTLAQMSLDQLSDFHSVIELAEQLKAAKSMLGDRPLTIRNVNRLLRRTDEKFSNEDKENIVRIVSYFTERDRQLYIGEDEDRKPCELAAYPRGDSNTLAFCVSAEGEPPRKKATLAEGLTLS